MAKQVILMAGLHKTATTSIQRTCLANHQALLDARFSYPLVRVGRSLRGNHTTLLNPMFRERPNAQGLSGQFTVRDVVTPSTAEQYRSDFGRELARRSDTIVLVAEGASAFSKAELAGMKQWFADQGCSMRVICHVRHVAPWVQSMIAQRVVGHMALTVTQAVEEFREAGGIVKPRIEALRATFSDVEFYSHESVVLSPGGPVGFFFKTIGFPAGPTLRAVRANEGRSDIATRSVSLVNERFGRARWQGSLAELDAHLQSAGMEALRALPGPKFTLRRDEIAPILHLVEQENTWLREQLGPGFAGAIPGYPEGAAHWSDAELAAVGQAAGALSANPREWLMGHVESAKPALGQ
jgi:hypothetical protein